jgi:hypothetical protein
MSQNTVDLYELLPALYRLQDAERGYPLREVLKIVSAQVEIIKQDIDGLWDDMFIETCADWVIPYIGDLVANNPLHEVAARRRADVAKTISYRRRKATLPMLEELARDVTGWGVHAVAFFELLGWTQNLNHARIQQAPVHDVRDPIVFDRVGTVNLRNLDALDRLDGPFDVICHTVDVRPISRVEGWYNIPKIGFFLWRLRHYALSGVTPRRASVPHGYHFSPLGNPAPLFSNPEREADPSGLAREIHVPGPIRPLAFHFSPGDYYGEDRNDEDRNGEDRSLLIVKDGDVVPLASVMCKDLRNWDRPPAGITGVLSGELPPFPALSVRAPEVGVTIGGEGPHTATLDRAPSNLDEARQFLEVAIQRAHASPAFRATQVVVVGNRLLVLPGNLGETVAFHPTPADTTTVTQLALSNKVAIDVHLGRIAFAVGDEPKNTSSVSVAYNYGFSANIGSGPYDRQRTGPHSDQPAPSGSDTVADPEALDRLIRVSSTEMSTITEALGAWNAARHPTKAVIQIEDNRTYEEDLTINMVAEDELVIQAENYRRPALIGNVTATGGGQGTRLVLNGLLISGSLHLQGGLEELAIAHCTLVPGRRLGEDGRPLEPELPSVIADGGNNHLKMEIDHSIVGSLRLPAEITHLRVQDSIIDSSTGDAPARLVPALISGNLSRFSTLRSDTPAVNVTIGDEGPHRAVFPVDQPKPTTVREARNQLQAAIRSAHDSSAFKNARVVAVPGVNRLIVLPGIPAAVIIEATEDDPTARELRLDQQAVRQVYALVTGALPRRFALSSASPRVNVTIGEEGPHVATLFGMPPDRPPRARRRLQLGVRNAHDSQAFKAALVAISDDDRLVVLPGTEGAAVTFSRALDDQTTLRELALESERPAIAASDGGERPGPPATLQRTTVFGKVHLKELILASEVIFNDPVVSERRQVGCVRFSHVPEGSQTPRRYRCQPDLALQDVTDPARRANTRARLMPSFTSVRYGHPAYAQLGPTCAEEIRTGSEDGSEIGACSSLKQPQRETNLRIRLEEYLPFGLEAGLVYVT